MSYGANFLPAANTVWKSPPAVPRQGGKVIWRFSIVDVVSALADSLDVLKKEGSQLATNCSQLKMESADGKRYLTDVADTEHLLPLVQSIPSPKAEPFKQWLAQVGDERIEETEDPERALDRAMETYLKKGEYKQANRRALTCQGSLQ